VNYDNDPEPGPTPRERALYAEVARLWEHLADVCADRVQYGRDLRRVSAERDEARALLRRTAMTGGASCPKADPELGRSRYKGCGSYPRAIGEIESILGITGAVPVSETVDAVRRLAAALRDCRAELAGVKRGAVTPAMLDEFEGGKEQRDRLRAALEKAESERDTARADYERVVKLMQSKDADWRRRQEGWRKSSEDHYAALQAKVARLLELYDVWLTARGASYQLAEDDFYQAVEALR
jgi:hypothetical protein